jgi:hypothetical protein
LTICLASLALSGCLTRKEVLAYIWENNGMPDGVCNREPELLKRGFYRRLNDDICTKQNKKIPCFELQPWCVLDATTKQPRVNPVATEMQSTTPKDLQTILDALLPENQKDAQP